LAHIKDHLINRLRRRSEATIETRSRGGERCRGCELSLFGTFEG
jgi:hypothetical protein